MAKSLEELRQRLAATSAPVGMQSSVFQQMLQQRVNGYNYQPPPVTTPVANSAAAAAQVTPTGGNHFQGDGHDHAGGKGLNPQFNSALSRLIKDSGGRVSIGSGYRSIAEQQVLYNRYKRGVKGQAPAAPPGRSNHNHGLAADLKYANAAAKAWVHANAAKYGLRFPMSYEPWHIEPLNAKSMRR